jgi:hypothetical protein
MPDNEKSLLIQQIKEKAAGLEEFEDLVLDKYLGELDMIIYKLRQACFKRPIDKWLEELELEIGDDLTKESGTSTGDLHG